MTRGGVGKPRKGAVQVSTSGGAFQSGFVSAVQSVRVRGTSVVCICANEHMCMDMSANVHEPPWSQDRSRGQQRTVV